MITAAAYLALVERGEGGLAPNSRLGEIVPECADTSLGSTTAIQAMSMSSALDNRLSAAWGTSEGMADHAAFPPQCDALGLSALQCVEQVVCPRYGREQPEYVANATLGCEDQSSSCAYWVQKGECEANPGYMLKQCEASCGDCELGSARTAAELGARAWFTTETTSCADTHPSCAEWQRLGQCDANPRFMLRECPAACAVCDGALDGRRQTRLGRARLCRYDNYAYTLLDAMVSKRTGRPLWRWVLELVAAPLRMHDMQRCMGGAADGELAGCFEPTATPGETLRPAAWRRWRGGPESVSWPSNGLFGSARDLLRFGAMLAGGGALEGRRVLGGASVGMMLSDYNDEGLECQGMDTMGLGIGHCTQPDEPRSRCRAREWWGWGSTYGHRLAILPATRHFVGRGLPALVCATFTNIATEEPPNDAAGVPIRIAARQHKYAHAQAAALRHLFPLLPAEETAHDDPIAWLTGQHNLTAALAEL